MTTMTTTRWVNDVSRACWLIIAWGGSRRYHHGLSLLCRPVLLAGGVHVFHPSRLATVAVEGFVNDHHTVGVLIAGSLERGEIDLQIHVGHT